MANPVSFAGSAPDGAYIPARRLPSAILARTRAASSSDFRTKVVTGPPGAT